jgi:glycerol-1-phosphatase
MASWMDTPQGDEAFPFDGLIVDLDGVVWRGSEAIPGSAATLNELDARGISSVFLTNDPSGSREEYAARLAHIGVRASPDRIVTSGRALASVIRDREGAGHQIYLIGPPALKLELKRAGLRVVRGEKGSGAKAVAVAAHEAFNYDELRIATHAILGGATLYASGRDATFPMPGGLWPATGAILAAVETATQSRAIVVGKPEAPFFDLARSLLLGCERIAIVGDHLESDIAGGKRAGLLSILVLTGTTSSEDLGRIADDARPDIVLPSLADLLAPVRTRKRRHVEDRSAADGG